MLAIGGAVDIGGISAHAAGGLARPGGQQILAAVVVIERLARADPGAGLEIRRLERDADEVAMGIEVLRRTESLPEAKGMQVRSHRRSFRGKQFTVTVARSRISSNRSGAPLLGGRRLCYNTPACLSPWSVWAVHLRLKGATTMLYRPFGKLGWKVSAIGLGTWALGNQWGELDDATAWATVRAAVGRRDQPDRHRRELWHPQRLFRDAPGPGADRHPPSGLSDQQDRPLGTAHRPDGAQDDGGHDPPLRARHLRPPAHRLGGRHPLPRRRPARADYLSGGVGDAQTGRSHPRLWHLYQQSGSGETLQPRRDLRHRRGGLFAAQPRARAGPTALLPGARHRRARARATATRAALPASMRPARISATTIRAHWHDQGKQQAQLERNLALVERIKTRYQPAQEMVNAALRYITSHPAAPVAIPGAKSPEQARMNAIAGEKLMRPKERAALAELLG